MSDKSDLLVIGGGINGVAIARDAARRGLSVTLVEREDIGAGTSADSTKLIHGGLRYLEYAEILLVYESLHERERLLRLAPHLVHPRRFMIPIYRQRAYSRPIIGAGLLMYDVLTGLGTKLQRSTYVRRNRFLNEVPAINDDGLKGGFAYYDGQAPFPERLCLEVALDAREWGAEILTRTEVTGFMREGDKVVGVRVVDHDTGDERELRAKLVVNASGAWVDHVLGRLNDDFPRQMGGTRGMHLLMPKRPGEPESALYTPALADERPFFIVPWRDYYWVGTTDVEHPGDPDTAVPTEAERDYLLNELRELIPGAEYTADDIIYAQSGVRPLPIHNREKPGAVTRKHIIRDHGKTDGVPGLWSVIGGKLTTFRHLAEQVVDRAYDFLESTAPPCPTKNLALPGAGEKSTLSGVDEKQGDYLYSLYGSRADDVLKLADEDAALGERLDPELPDIGAEIVWATRHEMARHLDDVLLRRTGIGTGHTEGLGVLERAAELMGTELGWDEDTRSREIVNYQSIIDRIHRVHQA